MVRRAAEHEVWFFHRGRRVVEGWAAQCVLCGWSEREVATRFVASLRLLQHSLEEHGSSPG